MSQRELKKQALALFKRISKDLNKDISPERCNRYIDSLESLKDDMFDEGFKQVEDYEELENVSGRGMFSDGADNEEISEVMDEVHNQLESILADFDVDVPANQNNSGQPVINVIQNNNQRAEASANVDIQIKFEIDKLVDEFNEEVNKPFPNKSKLQNIIDKIKRFGTPIAIETAKELIKKIPGMFS